MSTIVDNFKPFYIFSFMLTDNIIIKDSINRILKNTYLFTNDMSALLSYNEIHS